MPEAVAQTGRETVNAAYIENLSSGWHLLGTSQPITDLSIFASATLVWSNASGQWLGHGPSDDTASRIEASGYPAIDAIGANQGFWVYK